MSEINPVAISEQFDTYKDVKDDPYGAWAAIQALTTALSSAAVAEREPVAQFRKVGCSDWYDGLPDHQDGRGPYEERTLYLDPPPTSELETENARLKEALRTVEAQAANAAWNIGVARHEFTTADIQDGYFNIKDFARRVREGGKVDG